ncbi:MAG TPA: TerC family protein [Bacillales bacterium]|nr:TerC family protein [Bacillales bacterium]
MDIQADSLLSLVSIIMIDIILGGDNAVVIALACRKLPEKQRIRAIFFGTFLAIVLRAMLTVVVAYLLKIPFLTLTAGLLLVFIAFQLLIEDRESPNVKAGGTLAAAIRTIVAADLVMGLDNIVGIAGAAGGNYALIIIGFLFSVPIIVWGSRILLSLLESFPSLIYIGGGILVFTAARMITDTPQFRFWSSGSPHWTYTFWCTLPLFVLLVSWCINHVSFMRK